jgi:uncharacterized surface protein with fasciclin (FAS1) repeats
MKHRTSTIALALVFVLGMAAFAQETGGAASEPKKEHKMGTGMRIAHDQTIVTAAAKKTNLKTFTDWVKAADLTATLEGAGPFTVFAPTDSAFAKMPKDQSDALKADKTKLADFLKNHVVQGQSLKMGDLEKMNGQKLTTLGGGQLPLTYASGKTTVGTADVTGRAIMCKNGMIYEVDSVLMPGMAMPDAATPAPMPAGGK